MTEQTVWPLDPQLVSGQAIDEKVHILIQPVVNGIWHKEEQVSVVGVLAACIYNADELFLYLASVVEPTVVDRRKCNTLVTIIPKENNL